MKIPEGFVPSGRKLHLYIHVGRSLALGLLGLLLLCAGMLLSTIGARTGEQRE